MSRFTRTFVRVLVVGTLALGVGAVAASPAQAAYSDCSAGYVCLWYGTGGSATRFELYGNPGTCVSFAGPPHNNQADSFYNRLVNSHHVQFYDGGSCNGELLWRDGGCECGGPHAVGVQDNFYYAAHHGTIISHRNRVSSIWFNNG